MTECSILTRRIREQALALGFTHVGCVPAEPLTEERARLEQWLARGYHADMQWMARDVMRRTDPSLVLPGARSVIVVTRNYYHPADTSSDPDCGKISRYAWGDDYHDVMTPALRTLASSIGECIPGSESRVYVDTGPSMDKAWAVRAGLGWQGKHSNLITRDHGSWVFLGVVFTTAVLEYQSAIPDYCGSCTRCIDACPTRAIVAPYVVDSNRCLSYLTIELKSEEITQVDPVEMDGWVFGCDVCQDVCPWNRFARPSEDPHFAPRPGNTALPLTLLRDISDEDFRGRFRRSPIARAKARGLRRNARTLLRGRESH